MNNERLRLLVKVAHLYYVEGMIQQEIATHYGISRAQVSRFLTSARSEGIVEITIKNPFNDEALLENKLKEMYSLKDAIVVDISNADDKMADVLIGKAAAAFFENVVSEKDIIGIMAGKSITALAKEVNDITKTDIQYVPLVGGWGSEGTEWHSNTNTFLFAKNSRNAYSVLHAPAVVSTTTTKESFLKEPEILNIISLYKKLNIAVVGIGQISNEATHVKSTNMSIEDVNDLKNEGVVGSIATTFIDSEGQQVTTPYSDRMIGISGDELKAVPLVVGIARGNVKVDGIRAAIKGKWIDVLITDMNTAELLINTKNNKGESQ
ncbi:sugar-binding transcriptional regulator [Metaplanococcus flavidus]|uniref:Sugar-binding transcriptional regulator n=1 Tax=Metaplanococcus flavidus TaxID=569883 RepID=A0ABW3L9J9_9BACL